MRRYLTTFVALLLASVNAHAQFVTGQVLTATALNAALAAPTITGGSINAAPIGATTAASGKFTTLASSGVATLFGVTSPSTGQFYAGSGASISRIYDRLFVGDASLNNGTQVASQPDWLTQFQISTGRTGGFIQLASLAVLNGVNPQNNNAFVVATQSQYMNYAGGVIGALAIGVNNNTGYTTNAWGGYNEAYRMAGTTGGAYGLELDTVNYAGDTTTDPYQQASAQVIALQLAAGAELPSTGQYPSQAAINIQNNHSTFDAGIIIGSNAISGATGTSGTATAIGMGNGHVIQWFGGAGVKTSSITSFGTTGAGGIQQQFNNNTVQWVPSATAQPSFGITHAGSNVNYVNVADATTGNGPTISATGTDTNVSLVLSAKGTGVILANNPLNMGSTAAFTPSQTAGIVGTTTNNNANTGSVGEYLSNSATGASLTTATPANVTTLTLTAGDWDVSGVITFVPAGTTTATTYQASTNTTSATLGALGSTTLLQSSFAAGLNQTLIAPTNRVSVAGTTTVYLVAQASFATSTMTANGFIRARRVR